MLIVVAQFSETMDLISAPSDEFAKHDSLITSVRKDNFQRLAGELVYMFYLATLVSRS